MFYKRGQEGKGEIMRETPKELQVYKHFKGSLYQIVTIAIHTESSDRLVVYRSLSHPERVFARPLEMFLSEVNHKKYPDVKAKYRFTLIDDIEDKDGEETVVETEAADNKSLDEEGITTKMETEADADPDDQAVYKADGTLVLDPIIEKILDSKEYTDKIEAFELLRGKCDDNMLSTLAMALDIQLMGDTIEEKYADILKCLRMHQKYETNRLR